jgi:tetratricopeptide (TPR) repeat protein
MKQFQREASRRTPTDLFLRRSLHELATRTGDAALRDGIARELSRQGDEVIAPVGAAMAELAKPAPAPARITAIVEMANALALRFPQRSEPRLLLARCAELRGDSAQALADFTRAIELEPDRLAAIEAKFAHLFRTHPASAGRALDLLGRDPRMTEDAFLGMLANLAEARTPDEQARLTTMAETACRKSPVSLLWLAKREHAQGRTTAALALAQKAANAAPKLIDAWTLLATWQPAQASQIVGAARAVLDEASYYRLCAEVLPVLRRQTPGWLPEFPSPADRRTFARACLDSLVARQRSAEAKQMLNEMIDQPSALADDVAWARRNLALLSLAEGRPIDRAQAGNLVRDLKESPPRGIEEVRDQSTRLLIAARGVRGKARQAIGKYGSDIWRDAVKNQLATADDWFHRAQMERLAGRRSEASASLKEAMRRDPGNQLYVVARIDSLLADNLLAEVEPLVASLTGAAHDPRSAFAAARFFAMAGRSEECVAIVGRYVDSADAGSGDSAARVRHAADMLDQSARLALSKNAARSRMIVSAAIDRYAASLRAYPEAIGPMTLLMAQDEQTQAALDLLEARRGTLNSATMALAAVSVLQAGNATAKQSQTVKGWLDAALAESPSSIGLKLALAEWHVSRRDVAAAEPIYREILAKDPNNVHALNNLAWVLAPRGDRLDEAARMIDQAIQIAGSSGELLDTRARVLIARGNFDRAIDDLKTALEFGETSLRYFHLAIAQFKQLKKDDAVQSFREARARGLDSRMIHPTDLPAYKALAAQMGD